MFTPNFDLHFIQKKNAIVRVLHLATTNYIKKYELQNISFQCLLIIKFENFLRQNKEGKKKKKTEITMSNSVGYTHTKFKFEINTGRI